MPLATGVASTQWETALYKVLDTNNDAGSYPSRKTLVEHGIASGDAAIIMTGYRTYLTTIGSTANNIAFNLTAISGKPVNKQNTVQSLGDFGSVSRPIL